MEETLTQRVLAHVPTPQLHESYNVVLEEEFASVNSTVADVASSFAKLEEVRDAVAQLEQIQRSTGGRSTSLMAATANVLLLQRELEQKIGQLATGMVVTRLERKKEQEEEVQSKVGSPRVQKTRVEMNRDRVDRGAITEINDVDAGSKRAAAEVTRINDSESSIVTNGERGATNGETASVSSAESSSGSDDESESEEDEVDGSEAAWKALMTKEAEKKRAENQGPATENSETRGQEMVITTAQTDTPRQ